MTPRLRTGLVIAAVLLAQAVSRFAAAPVCDFTLDDWALLSRTTVDLSWADVLRVPLHDPDRPLGLGALFAEFKAFGDRPVCYNLFGLAASSLFLLGWLLLVQELGRDLRLTALTGLLFAALPNLTETFNWHTMSAYTPGLSAYLFSAWLLARRRTDEQHIPWLAALLYGIGLGTYENGAALPALFLLLCPGDARARVTRLLPFALALGLYAAWRVTKGFGLAHGLLYTPRELEISLWSLQWNARQLAGWWMGSSFLHAFALGWQAFQELPGLRRAVLLALNAGLAAAAVFALRRPSATPVKPPGAWSPRQLAAWGALWWAFASATCLISWTAGRLNYLPAPGVALVLALLLIRLPVRWTALPLALALVLGLSSSQGTARQWQSAGAVNRALYQHIQGTQAQWQDRDVVLIDTAALRAHRSTVTGQPADDPANWAMYGNAGLLRGFAPGGMVRLAGGAKDRPVTLLDVEHDARWQGDELDWSDRYDFATRHQTPRARVFVIDVMALAAEHGLL